MLKGTDFSQIVLLVLGVYCIFRGIMLLLNGKLSEREEASLKGCSEKGLKRYMLLSAMMNIVGGIVVIGISLVRMLNLIEPNLFRIIALAVLAVMVLVYVLIRRSCKTAA